MAKKKPSWIKDKEVRKKLPKGQVLPACFDFFIDAVPPIEVEWNDLESLGVAKPALKEALPFMRTGSGGVIAMWFHAADPAIIYLGSEGSKRVLAGTFDDFIKAIHAKKTGLPDLDESVEPFTVPGIKGKPKAVSAALQKKFGTWCKEHNPFQEPTSTADSETLRQRIWETARQMCIDKKRMRDFWRMDYEIWVYRNEDVIDKIEVEHHDKKVPGKYKVVPLIMELLKLVKKVQIKYDFSVYESGRVTLDKDKVLVLLPPGGEK
jgi:hypothetical protein